MWRLHRKDCAGAGCWVRDLRVICAGSCMREGTWLLQPQLLRVDGSVPQSCRLYDDQARPWIVQCSLPRDAMQCGRQVPVYAGGASDVRLGVVDETVMTHLVILLYCTCKECPCRVRELDCIAAL